MAGACLKPRFRARTSLRRSTIREASFTPGQVQQRVLMCGIAGIIRTDNTNAGDVAAVERMISAQTHRGPDGSGIHSEAHAVFGHRRLSIVDLSPAGRQPMSNEDGTV